MDTATHTDDARDGPRPDQCWHEMAVGGHRMASRVWQSDHTTGRRPVVLVHGLVVSSAYHVPLAEHLAVDWPVHAPDLPGFGRSGRPDRALDTRELGHALVAWAQARDLDGVALVANSYGCQVVAEALLLAPSLADRLILLGPTMDPRLRRHGAILRRWAREPQSGALQRLLVREYLSAGLGRAIATLDHALHDAIEEKLPHLDVPALVVRGTRDPIVEDDWATQVTGLLPQARLRRLPGATHAINHDMPLQTARVVRHFLHETGATPRHDVSTAAA